MRKSEQGVTSYYDANNRNLDRSVASFDVRQRVAFSGVWELPFLRNCGSMACRAVGRLAALRIRRAGIRPADDGIDQREPIPTATTTPTARMPTGPTRRPIRSAVPDSASSSSCNGVFSAADFPKPVLGTNGTLGRNTFRGPGFARVDLSLEKNIKFTERVSGSLRLESYNCFQSREPEFAGHRPDQQQFRQGDKRGGGRLYTVSLRLRF